MNHHSNNDDYVCEIAETIIACQFRDIDWVQSTTKAAPPTPTALKKDMTNGEHPPPESFFKAARSLWNVLL
ncbi:hypothetical protein HN51_066539, partial [Arachis hypogaea]